MRLRDIALIGAGLYFFSTLLNKQQTSTSPPPSLETPTIPTTETPVSVGTGGAQATILQASGQQQLTGAIKGISYGFTAPEFSPAGAQITISFNVGFGGTLDLTELVDGYNVTRAFVKSNYDIVFIDADTKQQLARYSNWVASDRESHKTGSVTFPMPNHNLNLQIQINASGSGVVEVRKNAAGGYIEGSRRVTYSSGTHAELIKILVD